ncbi:hypothetical protein CCYA_CCYA13G3550 [Cyanidiococcus yangmingshanensis]|nr:hypothetical protein CCYA_CCYA13G3550 [Cyanidiococcus yangmingshanensis]
MCFLAKCQNCKKYTWRGCGNHIQSVKQQAEREGKPWCECTPEQRRPG